MFLKIIIKIIENVLKYLHKNLSLFLNKLFDYPINKIFLFTSLYWIEKINFLSVILNTFNNICNVWELKVSSILY